MRFKYTTIALLLATTPINAEITHIREDQVNGRPELIDITRAKINEFSRRFEVFRSEHAKIHAIHVDLGGRNGSGLTAAVNELIVTAQGISEDMESVYDFLSHISNENLTTAEKLGHINAKITEANTQSLTAFDNLLEISRDRQLLLTQLAKLEALETNSREFDVQFLEIIDGSDKTESATLQASSSALITQYNNSKSIAKTALTQVRSSLNHSMFETLPENVKLAHEITQNLLYLGSQNYKAIETELEAVRQLLWYDEHARPLLEELKREKQYGVTLIFSNRYHAAVAHKKVLTDLKTSHVNNLSSSLSQELKNRFEEAASTIVQSYIDYVEARKARNNTITGQLFANFRVVIDDCAGKDLDPEQDNYDEIYERLTKNYNCAVAASLRGVSRTEVEALTPQGLKMVEDAIIQAYKGQTGLRD